jgi:hypothetical protein
MFVKLSAGFEGDDAVYVAGVGQRDDQVLGRGELVDQRRDHFGVDVGARHARLRTFRTIGTAIDSMCSSSHSRRNSISRRPQRAHVAHGRLSLLERATAYRVFRRPLIGRASSKASPS